MPHKTKEERRAYAAEYYKRNKEKLDSYKKNWINENPGKNKLHAKNYNDKTTDKRKWYTIKHRYGLTQDDFNNLIEQQNNCCALCSSSFETVKVFVDHCHVTNTVRGLLCPSCNTALGLIQDDLLWLAKAKKYLTEKA